MSKENFKDFVIEDLTWWINVTDYPTEIKDNQSIECSNWNFDWSKLVSDKWIEEKLDVNNLIQSMTIDWEDIWHITEWTLYKNLTNQDDTWWIFIKLKELSDTWDINWLIRYITIDWVEYWVPWLWTSALNNLISQFDINVYKVSPFSWWLLLTRKDWEPIIYSFPYSNKILMWTFPVGTFAPTENLPYAWWFFNWEAYATLWGWNLESWASSSRANNMAHAVNMLSRENLSLWWIWNVYEWIVRMDRTSWTLCFDTSFNSLWFIQYHLTVMPTTVKYCGILINKWKPTDTFEQFPWIGMRYLQYASSLSDFTIEQDWVNYTRANLYSYIDNYSPAWFKIIDSRNLLWAWSSTTTILLMIYADWRFPSTTYIISWAVTPRNTFSKVEMPNYSIDWYEITETWWWDWVEWLADITVWNLSTLVVNKNIGWAYVSYEWLKIPIWEESIWKPTCWTIYNWKIILWGYPNNDNIIFSQTSTPREPLNILNFTDYSAWGQSISGWDKWEVRGFSVWENWLYVFKNNSVWYSNSEKDSADAWTFNFIFNKITSNWALSQRVITNVQQDIFYLDWENKSVRRLSYEKDMNTLRDNSISDDIRWLISSLPEDQPLATASFHYPNYILSLTDWTSDEVTYLDWNTYKLNNKHFIYNVDKKSWATKTWIDDLIVWDKGYIALNDWKIYKLDVWNTLEDWIFLSKKYVITNDSRYKRLWHVDIVWRITPDNLETKTITVEVIIDWVVVETRNISSTTNIYDFTERIDMYNDWQYIQFRITHTWEWKAELIDIYINYKPINWYNKNYF